jgi:hypothetical protein
MRGSPAMNELLGSRQRAFTWDDIDALAELAAACEAEDSTGESAGAELLRIKLAMPGRDACKTTVLFRRDNGELAASASGFAAPGIHEDAIQVNVRLRRAAPNNGLRKATRGWARRLKPRLHTAKPTFAGWPLVVG